MRTYLWAALILIAIETVARVLWIARDQYPLRTREEAVVDLVIGLLLAGWVAHLLTTGKVA